MDIKIYIEKSKSRFLIQRTFIDVIPRRYFHVLHHFSAQKMKFSTKEFFSKRDQIRSFRSHIYLRNP